MPWTLTIFWLRRLSCSLSILTCLLNIRSVSATSTLTSIRIPTAFSTQLPSFWRLSIAILWSLVMMTSPFTHGVAQTSRTSWRSRKTMRKQLLLSWSKTTAQQDIFWRLPTQLLRTTLTASQSASSPMKEMVRRSRCIRHPMSVMRAHGLALR